MQVFGPWLPILFGVGSVLLLAGLVAVQYAQVVESRPIRTLGGGAVSVGWRLLLAAVSVYVMIRALEAIFATMVSSLP